MNRRNEYLSVALLLLAICACSGPPVSEGTMECLICGASEEHRWVGRRLENAEPNPASDFNRWFETELGAEHDHDWAPTGCHFTRSGGRTMVACHPVSDTASIYQDSIMRFADSEVSRRLVRGIVAATSEQRRAVLATGFLRSGSKIVEFSELEDLPAGDFEKAWRKFLAPSPAWRDIWELGND